MSLSNPKYLLFLSIVVVLFYLLRPGRARGALLLIASYFFYFNLSSFYVLVLAVVTAVTYAAGILLSASEHPWRRRVFFVGACVIVLAPLLAFKYLGFLLNVSASLLSFRSPTASSVTLILPIGISFFTFAALGYVIDVYLEVIEPEWRPLEIALFLAFFPLVTAGPIERAGSFLPEFDFKTRFSSKRAFAALRLIFLGVFLKVLCADNLIRPVDAIYAAPQDFIPVEKLFGVIHYMFYIYTDFAGYSLIAIGSAAMLGLKVRPNFRQPFLSTTVPEFWRNWHISLTSWVRDYLFTPMRMGWRCYPNLGLVAALMISFLIIGIWHGVGWGFALFGLMHGLLVVGSTYTLSIRDAAWAWIGAPTTIVHINRIVWTFVLVMLTFVVYRANSIRDAVHIYRDLFSVDILLMRGEPTAFQVISSTSWTWAIIALVIAGDIAVRNGLTLSKLRSVVQVAICSIGTVIIVYEWIWNSAAQPFLYYRF
jgi:D-alanyl-lipoteichoic acid acyltransferase DltB (MBOAT superfamily)